eukprot:TRINITY_DN10_c0_g1_i1.p1 TRINITY_DN10_c0_g1~~TRINITY_DN10_c0_g1_i1.p1  ORF type:complete len:169 (-),score=5.04 TRINITY_DN10_c0_g1_i1:63-569(-)
MYFPSPDPSYNIYYFVSPQSRYQVSNPYLRSPSYENSYQSDSLQLYHGTSADNLPSILRNGLQPSRDGQLGSGVYLAREEKADNFARDSIARGKGQSGGVVLKCEVDPGRAKYVSHASRAGNWQHENYDAVRCDETYSSTKMEWCVSDPRSVKVKAYRFHGSDQWYKV